MPTWHPGPYYSPQRIDVAPSDAGLPSGALGADPHPRQASGAWQPGHDNTLPSIRRTREQGDPAQVRRLSERPALEAWNSRVRHLVGASDAYSLVAPSDAHMASEPELFSATLFYVGASFVNTAQARVELGPSFVNTAQARVEQGCPLGIRAVASARTILCRSE